MCHPAAHWLSSCVFSLWDKLNPQSHWLILSRWRMAFSAAYQMSLSFSVVVAAIQRGWITLIKAIFALLNSLAEVGWWHLSARKTWKTQGGGLQTRWLISMWSVHTSQCIPCVSHASGYSVCVCVCVCVKERERRCFWCFVCWKRILDYKDSSHFSSSWLIPPLNDKSMNRNKNTHTHNTDRSKQKLEMQHFNAFTNTSWAIISANLLKL